MFCCFWFFDQRRSGQHQLEKDGVNAARRCAAVDGSLSPVFKFMKENISQQYITHWPQPEGVQPVHGGGGSPRPSALFSSFFFPLVGKGEKSRTSFPSKVKQIQVPTEEKFLLPRRRSPSAQVHVVNQAAEIKDAHRFRVLVLKWSHPRLSSDFINQPHQVA